MKIILLIINIFIVLVANCTEHPKNSLTGLDLIKFYYLQQDYEMVLDLVKYTDVDSLQQDSVKFYKGMALKGQEKWDIAADEIINLIIFAKSDSLRDSAILEIKEIILKLTSAEAINKTAFLINNLQEGFPKSDFLLFLAEIYEKYHLFGEAREAYQEVLKDSAYSDTTQIYLKIAVSDIFLKKYDDSIDILEQILLFQDKSYAENALFFYYVASESNDDIARAKEILIYLYKNYPLNRNRFEIIEALSNIFYEEKQYLMSWYLLDEVYKISSEAEKFRIYQKIYDLKKTLLEETISIDQFKYFEPILENEE